MNRRQFMKSIVVALAIPLLVPKRFFTTVEMVYSGKGRYMITGMAMKGARGLVPWHPNCLCVCIPTDKTRRVIEKISSKQDISFSVYYDK